MNMTHNMRQIWTREWRRREVILVLAGMFLLAVAIDVFLFHGLLFGIGGIFRLPPIEIPHPDMFG